MKEPGNFKIDWDKVNKDFEKYVSNKKYKFTQEIWAICERKITEEGNSILSVWKYLKHKRDLPLQYSQFKFRWHEHLYNNES